MGLQSIVLCRDADVLEILLPIIQNAGIQMHLCHDLREATALLSQLKFDAIIVDCEAPPDGITILEDVRKHAANRNAITLAIAENPLLIQAAQQTGVSFVLQKPIRKDMTKRTISAAKSLMISERRRFFRYPVELPVQLKSAKEELLGKTINLSESGVAVRTSRQMEPGWAVTLQFELPPRQLLMKIKAEIVWSDATLRAGLRFLHIPQKSQAGLQDWLKEKFEQG
jgi:CheY-like chemotaxis protein